MSSLAYGDVVRAAGQHKNTNPVIGHPSEGYKVVMCERWNSGLASPNSVPATKWAPPVSTLAHGLTVIHLSKMRWPQG